MIFTVIVFLLFDLLCCASVSVWSIGANDICYYQGISAPRYSNVSLPLIISTFPSFCRSSITRLFCSEIYDNACLENFCDECLFNCSIYFSALNISLSCNPSSFSFDSKLISYGALDSRKSRNSFPIKNYFSNCSQYSHSNFSTMGISSMVANYSYGVCSGIVSDIFLPPGPLVSPSLGLFASPGSILEYMERNISTYLSQMPSWISADCHFALRKYFCGSYFLKPEKVHLSDVIGNNISLATLNSSQRNELLNWTFYVPSYPDRSVCVEYESKCQDFINRQNWPFLIPNCSKKVEIYDMYISTENRTSNSSTSVMVDVFPNISQVVSRVEIYGIMLPLSSSPNMMLDSNDEGYYPRCPGDFVVPQTTSIYTKWIEGTACSYGCRSPYWTSLEWKVMDATFTVLPAIGLPLIILVISLWVSSSKRHHEHLLFSFALISSLSTVIFVVVSFFPNKTMFCKDNAHGYDASDGFNLCSVQSIIFIYSSLGCSFSWGLQCVDLYLRIVKRIDTTRFQSVELIFVYVAPLIPVLYIINDGLYGYGGILPFCSMSAKGSTNDDLKVLYAPTFLVIIIGGYCMISTIYVGVNAISEVNRRRAKSDDVSSLPSSIEVNNLASQSNGGTHTNNSSVDARRKSIIHFSISDLKAFRSPIIFVLVYIIVWISIFTARFEDYFHDSLYVSEFHDWIDCVFAHADNNFDDFCGFHPKKRYSFALMIWMLVGVTGQSFLISFVFIFDLSFSSIMKWFVRLNFRYKYFKTDVVPMDSAVVLQNVGNEDVRHLVPGADLELNNIVMEKKVIKNIPQSTTINRAAVVPDGNFCVDPNPKRQCTDCIEIIGDSPTATHRTFSLSHDHGHAHKIDNIAAHHEGCSNGAVNDAMDHEIPVYWKKLESRNDASVHDEFSYRNNRNSQLDGENVIVLKAYIQDRLEKEIV